MNTTTSNTLLILQETTDYILAKFDPEMELYLVTCKANGRIFGLRSQKDAERFAFRRGWETSDLEQLERRRSIYGEEFYQEMLKKLGKSQRIVVP